MSEPSGEQRPLLPPGSCPAPWIHCRRAWRLSRYVGRREIDWLLRIRTARDLPLGYRARLATMGLPGEAINGTLRAIRSLAGWSVAWTATAQRFLGETRRPDAAATDDRDPVIARARQRAAFCYHVAHWLAYDDPKAIRTMRSAAVSLFQRSMPALLPDLRPVHVPWRGKDLAGYLRLPVEATGRLPLVVLLNGLTTSKEELILWSDAFLAQGQAVLALDQPGTGESADLAPVAAHDHLSDAIIDFAAMRPELDERRVALVGISLGGTQAVHAAAADRRIAATVAVTPPFTPDTWLDYVNDVVWEQIVGVAGGEEALPDLAARLALRPVIADVRSPLLVIGAGRDLVVPPAEAIRLAAAAGRFGTLLWYGEAGHALYEAIPWWTADAAAWLDAIIGPMASVTTVASTRVDATVEAPAGSGLAMPG